MTNHQAVPQGHLPDYRAIYVNGRFTVVPWRESLKWAEAHFGHREGVPPIWRRGDAAFEIWCRPSGLIARSIADDAAPDAVEALQGWARERSSDLEIGSPLPVGEPHPEPIALEFRETLVTPTFRFVFQPENRLGKNSLVVDPWGFSSPIEHLYEPFTGAVGDLFADDDENLRAVFCRGDEVVRSRAQDALSAWAALDGWLIHFEPGDEPLASPSPPVEIHPAVRVCSTCGSSAGTGWASHLKHGSEGCTLTRCRICGGRYRWHVPNA